MPPVVCNAVIVGAMLAWESTGFSAAFAGLFAYNALTVGIGEAAVCFLLGVPLLLSLIHICPHCGKSTGFTKEEDTLDGWFDSGSTHFAAMKKDQGFWPATMYLEGLDQYRGWFQSSLLTAVGAFGEGAPFKEMCIRDRPSPAVCGMASQISSQVKARMGAKSLARVESVR